jgi:hypothetical protein
VIQATEDEKSIERAKVEKNVRLGTSKLSKIAVERCLPLSRCKFSGEDVDRILGGSK